jgi:hypothetical protein
VSLASTVSRVVRRLPAVQAEPQERESVRYFAPVASLQADFLSRRPLTRELVEPSRFGGAEGAPGALSTGGADTGSSTTGTGAGIAGGGADIGAIAAAVTVFIPNEIIVIYAVLVSIFGTNPWTSNGGCTYQPSIAMWSKPDIYLFLGFIVCAITAPLIIYFSTKTRAPSAGRRFQTPWFDMGACCLAFVAWANYLPNSIVAHCLDIPGFGSAALLVTVMAPLAAIAYVTGRNAPALAPTDQQRRGEVPIVAAPIDGGNAGRLAGNDVDTRDALDGAAPNPSPVSGTACLVNPMLVPVFMGAWDASTSLQTLRGQCIDFLRAYIGGSTFRSLSVYGVEGARLADHSQAILSNVESGAVLTTDQVTNALGRLVTDATQAFIVFCAPGVNVTNGGEQSCENFCGFHDAFRNPANPGLWVSYSVIAHADDACPKCSTARRPPASIMSAAAHELCEMMTNPNPGAGTGWATATPPPREIADNCQGPNNDPNSYAGFYVQQIYIASADHTGGVCT